MPRWPMRLTPLLLALALFLVSAVFKVAEAQQTPTKPPAKAPPAKTPPAKTPPVTAAPATPPVRTFDTLPPFVVNPPEHRPYSKAKVTELGIRQLEGKYLTLFTDLPADPSIDELPKVFDLAVPMWAEYFATPATDVTKFRMRGCIMKDKAKFVASGLLPPDVPEFPHGYQLGREFWLFEQPSEYYRRHLFLHEGTHGFMNLMLGGLGTPWYAEGVAELFGTHRWAEGKLTMRYFPTNREEVPYWGRTKLINMSFAKNEAKTLSQIFRFTREDNARTETYAWCWASAAFFDTHPRYQTLYRAMQRQVTAADFDARFQASIVADWPRICEEWQLFIVNMDYGYDIAREAVVYREAELIPPVGATVSVAADRGWQSSRLQLAPKTKYKIEGLGRYQLAEKPAIWMSEPQGISIQYHKSIPLGTLLGAVIPKEDAATEGLTPLIAPKILGRDSVIDSGDGGILYLRVNDAPWQLHDNRGSATVRIKPVP